jgi:hypothetical protein
MNLSTANRSKSTLILREVLYSINQDVCIFRLRGQETVAHDCVIQPRN